MKKKKKKKAPTRKQIEKTMEQVHHYVSMAENDLVYGTLIDVVAWLRVVQEEIDTGLGER